MNKIDNLYSFMLIILSEDYMTKSPSYIKEKWDRYIGIKPISNIELNDKVLEWSEKWSCTNNDIINIFKLVEAFNRKEYNTLASIYRLSKVFEKYTGIKTKELSDEYNGGLHNNLNDVLKLIKKPQHRLIKIHIMKNSL